MRIARVARPDRGALDGCWTLAALALLLAWEASGLDLPLARLAGGSGFFPWREHWLLARVLHADARDLAWLVGAWLLAGVWWPTGVLKRLSRAARVEWVVSAFLGVLLVNLLKYASPTSCP